MKILQNGAALRLPIVRFFERLTDQTLFPERSGLQSTVPILGWGRVKWRRSMDELAAVFIGLCSAGIFLAHAIDAYQAESAGSKDTQPEA